MARILLLILVLLMPISSEAAFNIYLRNGSVIAGVSSYEKRGGEIIIQFGGGSMGISEKEVVRIEETTAPEKYFRSAPAPETGETREEPVGHPAEDAGNKNARVEGLKGELESIDSELKALTEDEARVTASINERRSARTKYNIIQLRQLEKDLEPMQQELFSIQQKKQALIQRKAQIEGELRALE